MKNQEIIQEIFDTIVRYNHYMFRSGKAARLYGTKHYLHQDQIHVIVAIGRNAGCNLRTLSEIMGASLPTISLQIERLRKMGLVTKCRSNVSQREVALNLTEDGKAAFDFHEKRDAEFYQNAMEFLSGFSEEEQKTIRNFLTGMDQIVDYGLMPPL